MRRPDVFRREQVWAVESLQGTVLGVSAAHDEAQPLMDTVQDDHENGVLSSIFQTGDW